MVLLMPGLLLRMMMMMMRVMMVMMVVSSMRRVLRCLAQRPLATRSTRVA
jgi:hypothetical protein